MQQHPHATPFSGRDGTSHATLSTHDPHPSQHAHLCSNAIPCTLSTAPHPLHPRLHHQACRATDPVNGVRAMHDCPCRQAVLVPALPRARIYLSPTARLERSTASTLAPRVDPYGRTSWPRRRTRRCPSPGWRATGTRARTKRPRRAFAARCSSRLCVPCALCPCLTPILPFRSQPVTCPNLQAPPTHPPLTATPAPQRPRARRHIPLQLRRLPQDHGLRLRHQLHGARRAPQASAGAGQLECLRAGPDHRVWQEDDELLLRDVRDVRDADVPRRRRVSGGQSIEGGDGG